MPPPPKPVATGGAMTEPLAIGTPPRPGPSRTSLRELIRALQELLDEPGHEAAEMVGHDPPVLAVTTHMLAAAVSITTADEIDWTPAETDASLLDELLGSPSATQPHQEQQLRHQTKQDDEQPGGATLRDSAHDPDAAVAAGVLAAGRAAAHADGTDVDVGEAAAAAAAAAENLARTEAATAASSTDEPPHNWAPFGQVFPVLGAAPGVGASFVATALTDLLTHEHHRRVLLVDGAEPATSGLAEAAAAGPVSPTSIPAIGVQQARRGPARLARLEVRGSPVVAAGMLPSPTAWLPTEGWWNPEATVVDLGWDAARVAANPAWAPARWLQAGTPAPAPVFVVRASRPCLTRADMILHRLAPWAAAGQILAPAALVVVGARRWPKGVVGAVSDRLAGLMDDAVFLPRDDAMEVGGITETPVPARLRSYLRPLARRLTDDPTPTETNSSRPRVS